MKRIFLSVFTFFILLFGFNAHVVGMEESSQNKPILTSIPVFLGFSQEEVKKNSGKQNEYLGKLRSLASLLLVQEKLRKNVATISEVTDIMQDCLKDGSYYRTEFKYTDRPCRINQIPCGSEVVFADGDREREIFPDTFVLTTPEAKAAYLQAKNLLKVKNCSAFDRMERICNRQGLLTIEKTRNKLNSFIETLLSSENKELDALRKWLKHTCASEQRLEMIAEANSLLRQIIESHDPLFFERFPKTDMKEYYPIIKKNLDASGFIEIHLPSLYPLLGVNGKCIQFFEDCEDSDELPNFELYEEFRSVFIEPYTLANERLMQDKAIYAALYKELFSYFQDKTHKNRLELMKKYSKPLYLGEYLGANFPADPYTVVHEPQNLSSSSTDDTNEWIDDAKKGQIKNKKKAQAQQQQKQQKKKAAEKKGKEKRVQKLTVKAAPRRVDQKQQQKQQQVQKQNKAIIKYDERIMRWLDSAFLEQQNPNDRSILYHTFSFNEASRNFEADQFIIKYGVQVQRANRTHVHKMDTIYYMGGEIQYTRGERVGQRETVLFVICKDADGICYHRGFDRKEDSLFKEFETNEFEHHFPSLHDDQFCEKKSVNMKRNNVIKKDPVEGTFCIEIDDDENNGVTIVLYKPTFETN